MSTEDSNDFNELFPTDFCISAVAELNSWTPVQAIASASRIIENRCIENDDPQSLLIMPIDERLHFERVFFEVLVWLIKGYEPPKYKVDFSKVLDEEIKDETIKKIKDLRFNPKIVSQSRQENNGDIKKYFLIQDKAEVIELISFPLRALMDVFFMGFDSAWSGYQIRKDSHQKTGSYPTIYHTPYADSRLFSVIQALCFFSLGMEVTVNYGRGKMQIVNDYRSVNVQARPPFNKELISLALQLSKGMK